jgi:hypothetical protein
MKKEILEISEKLRIDEICEKDAENQLLHLFNHRWFDITEKEPPNNIEIIAKSPSGILHLTNWRTEYGIFMCMGKSEDINDWQWKFI